MSTVKSKNLQVGTDATASNNFTIYQPSTPDGTLRIGVGNADSPTEVGRFTSSGLDLGTNTLTQNNLTGFTAKAWVKFNGTGTPAIIGSGNVSSITDIGTGTQTVNFTTAMPDTNYAAIVTTTWASGVTENVTGLIYNDSPYAPATTSVTTKTYNFNTGAAVDSSIVMLVIFR